MKFLQIASVVLLSSGLLMAHQASALSEDDKSMNSAGGSPRFSDPDENVPGQAMYMQGGQTPSTGVDPSTVRYDYDPTSGSYIPHKN
jgi:hypothetical protein